MKKRNPLLKSIGALFVLGFAVFAVPSVTRAQVHAATEPQGDTPVDISTTQPIVVKQHPAKAVWLKATIVHADANSMIVREQGNEMAIHTFTYSDNAREKMESVLADGGYQSGDTVKVLWLPGSSQALKIKGRPSKAI
jgi:hypothetical protein